MLEVYLLGKFQVNLDGQPIEIPSRPMQSLLAYLILNAGTAFRREKLGGLLWPDFDEQSARHNLRQTLWRLGKVIGKEHFKTDKVSVAFNPQTDYWLDTAVLQEVTAEQSSVDQLIAGVSVYDDILLPGFYDEWVLLERERLRAIYEDRMQLLLERLVDEECWRETRAWAERWIALGQVPEPAYRALMMAHAGLGDQAGVTGTYRRCVEALAEEVGVEPSPETSTLYERLSSGQDLPQPAHGLARPRPTTKLPIHPTPFIGRQNELKEIGALLTDPEARLVTILGPGGIGKTRLSIEAARAQRDDFADGIYYVSLAALDDPNLIATNIADAINFSFQARDQRQNSPESRQNEQLLAYLRDRQMLLLLDNLEHLAADLSLITKTLQAAAGVTMLTTSRERLNLRGETVYMPGGMRVPPQTGSETLEIVKTHDALQFFVKCAERANPRFELADNNLQDVITVCRLVDGLPLGIELAAAWVALLAPAEIAAEIKTNLDFLSSDFLDTPDRQQSIRSVFESSWNRLAKTEQDIFQRLSVFRSGFTHHAAQDIAKATLRTLMALVNKSLIQPDYSGRYQIHELLRQYGREKLLEAGQMEQTKDRHLAFFMEMAQESAPHLWGSEQLTWLNTLDVEHDNLRAALEWSQTAAGKAEEGLLLAASLDPFWGIRGYFDEGREYLAAALTRPEAARRTAARAEAARAAGHLAYMQGDYQETRTNIEESLSIYREVGPSCRSNLAHALITLGDMETELGDYATASSLMQEGLDIMRELGDEGGIARALWQLGACFVRTGELEQAAQYYEEALPLLRKIGERSSTAITLSGLAEIAIRHGDYERAAELEEESLALRREIDEAWGIAVSLANLAWIALLRDDIQEAASLLVESMALRRDIGDKGGIAWCLEKLAGIALTKGQQESPPEHYRWAARLFGAANALRAPIGSAIDLIDQPEHDRQITLLRALLDEPTFSEAWVEGQTMDLDRFVEYALAAGTTSNE